MFSELDLLVVIEEIYDLFFITCVIRSDVLCEQNDGSLHNH